jgi:hypothetical protein
MKDPVQLNDLQQKIMRNFYSRPNIRISLNKIERKEIWDNFVSNRDIQNISHLEKKIPALYAEMAKAIEHEKNIQPAVFSECVYAQSLAEKFELSVFKDHINDSKLKLKIGVQHSKELNELTVRYSFSNLNGDRVLYQAGGASSVDCAFHSQYEDQLIWIEMKEAYARTSEPDLPKYAEDGYIISSETFEKTYPQFKSMLEEQIEKRLNVFEHVGNNISDFSVSSIEKAVTENYSGEKLAHVICTEDDDGMLVMLPSNHVAKWSKIEGEIRPSGRNSYSVWTPLRLFETLNQMNAEIDDNIVRIPLAKLKSSNARGSRSISRYKIDPLFFVRESNVTLSGQMASFALDEVRQLNPSITAKMNFKGLKVSKVQDYYSELI